MKYRLAIFDFDGTLADSFPFFVGIFNQLARQHGFREIAAEAVPVLRHYSAHQMMRYVGLPKWKLPLVTRSFIALMRQDVAGIAPFPQADALLHQLDEAGIVLAVATSNSHDNVARILGPDTMRRIRHLESGMSIFGKAARIRKVLQKTGIAAGEAIYIGDQGTDMAAARQAGVACGAVAWGYGSIESLRQHAPDEEFAQIAAISRIAA
ncbi:MAG: HAD hydrolase-like protein [Burkholderiaceae bacterium]